MTQEQHKKLKKGWRFVSLGVQKQICARGADRLISLYVKKKMQIMLP